MGFYEVAASGQDFAEKSGMMGENFSYQNTTLIGVFNQVEMEYTLQDFSVRKITALVCVSSKEQWEAAGLVPADRGTITYGSIGYLINDIAGANSAGEPAYQLTLFKQT